VSTITGRISLRLAMSLDGYIADPDGGYDWIQDVPSVDLDTEHQVPFEQYLQDVDVVVMGSRCFDEGGHTDYVRMGTPVIVATSRPPDTTMTGVEFTNDVLSRVRQERDAGHHCFLFGGGKLVTSFLRADLVDQLTVGVVPVLLGEGRRLFHENRRRIDLRLVDYTLLNGKVRLTFERR
jgi:dihydrofolate reductase